MNKDKLLNPREFQRLPKVELHVHLDCCLSFDAVSRLKPGITKEEYAHDFIGIPKYKDLADFLKIIDNSLVLLQTEQGLRLAVEDLFQQFKADHVIYGEIRFAPFLHVQQGLEPEQVVGIVEESVSRCAKDTGIEAGIILCALRHYSQQQSMDTVKLVEQFRGTRVVALDLSADEAGFPIDAHVPAFHYAREQGLYFTAHAGEARGAESVRETLSQFKTTRIGHGVRSIEDPQLLEELKEDNIHLEVCPSCNIQIDVFDTYTDHPVDKLYNAGVSIGINTDTRSISDITLSEEYRRLQEVFGWNTEHFLKCNRNALGAAFIPQEKRNRLELKLI